MIAWYCIAACHTNDILSLVTQTLFYYKKRSGDSLAWKVLKRLVWISKLLLPAISLTISRTFQCYTYDAGDDTQLRVLAVDQSIDCDTDYYKAMFFYAVLMTALFPGEYRAGDSCVVMRYVLRYKS